MSLLPPFLYSAVIQTVWRHTAQNLGRWSCVWVVQHSVFFGTTQELEKNTLYSDTISPGLTDTRCGCQTQCAVMEWAQSSALQTGVWVLALLCFIFLRPFFACSPRSSWRLSALGMCHHDGERLGGWCGWPQSSESTSQTIEHRCLGFTSFMWDQWIWCEECPQRSSGHYCPGPRRTKRRKAWYLSLELSFGLRNSIG